MKIIFTIIILFSFWSGHGATAAEVGDIYFSDKTFASTMQSGKQAIGVVYWVSPNKDFGYIMSLDEPTTTMNVFNANVYCLEYYTEGTLAGDWKLPQRIELIRMGKYKVNGTVTDNYTAMNNILSKVTKADGNKATTLGNKSYVANSAWPYCFNPYSGVISGGGGNTQASGTKYSVRCITAFQKGFSYEDIFYNFSSFHISLSQCKCS